ncbi:regulatory-associated protein of TOR 1-like [Humulus lupulus]|uniref:regulatory-associated protein of TOR 1-like n=1 Tax=Humulus lupulus TaxID=3486 RepID=UPI002B409E8A|nr:regulatory-associated protein of TOR 1-like [Humulus lupulus]
MDAFVLAVIVDGHRRGQALGRFSFGHNNHLKSIAAAYWKHTGSPWSSLPSLAHRRSPSSVVPSQIGPISRVGTDSSSHVRDGRVCTSSPLATSGLARSFGIDSFWIGSIVVMA